MLFRNIRKLYYFMFYCNFRIMDTIADKYMKNSPIHGWSWPMFILIFNLATIDSLLNLNIFSEKNFYYCAGTYVIVAIFNFFVFTNKNRSKAIIEECSRLPYRFRRFGVTFFAYYSILSMITLFVVLIAGWKI